MILAGKCPPEEEELKETKRKGFENVELYLEKKHLDNFQESLEIVEDSELEVVSIHTPHVHLEDKGYLVLADKLAQDLGAYLVFHSQYLHHTHIPELENLDIGSEYGYENNPGASQTFLQNAILDEDHDMVLDTAHFYLGDHTPDDMKSFLKHNIAQISLIHLCDSSNTKDGLGFGEGVMEMEKICQLIDNSGFDGILILEVMPEHQEDALEKWRNYTS